MANVNQLANIISGHTKGLAMNKQRRAQASLGQYRHQKEIIENINKAIEEAREKSKKNKGLFGLGGSLLGSLLGVGLGWAIPVLGPSLASAIGAYGGSKMMGEQQLEDSNWDSGLDDLETRYKNRKQESLISQNKAEMKSVLEDSIESKAMMDAFTSFIMPTDAGKEVKGWDNWKKAGMSGPSFIEDWLSKGLKGNDKSFIQALGDTGWSWPSRLFLPTMLESGKLAPWKEEYTDLPSHVKYSGPQFRNPYGGMGGY